MYNHIIIRYYVSERPAAPKGPSYGFINQLICTTK